MKQTANQTGVILFIVTFALFIGCVAHPPDSKVKNSLPAPRLAFFSDNFEGADTADIWFLDRNVSVQAVDDGNSVLRMSTDSWASPRFHGWWNYITKLRFLVPDDVHSGYCSICVRSSCRSDSPIPQKSRA